LKKIEYCNIRKEEYMDKDVIRYYKVYKATVRDEARDDGVFIDYSEPKGVVVAVCVTRVSAGGDLLIKEIWRIGWSLCGKKDRFDKRLGREIARGMAIKGSKRKVPEEMKEEICKVKEWLETGKNGEKREVIISGNMD
jgi:hypothetical protein